MNIPCLSRLMQTLFEILLLDLRKTVFYNAVDESGVKTRVDRETGKEEPFFFPCTFKHRSQIAPVRCPRDPPE
jgi:hypothetical protein